MRSRAQRHAVFEREDAPAWTRIRTPSPEITYAPWGHHMPGPSFGYPSAELSSTSMAAMAGPVALTGLIPQQQQLQLHQQLYQLQQQQQQQTQQQQPQQPQQQQPQPQRFGETTAAPFNPTFGHTRQLQLDRCFYQAERPMRLPSSPRRDDEDEREPGWSGGPGEMCSTATTPRCLVLSKVLPCMEPEEDCHEDSVATPRLGPMAGVESIMGAPSRGSVGHPAACAPACKYARKKRGCKDGADCSHCHLCVWHSQRPRSRFAAAAAALADAAGGAGEDADHQEPPQP
mmetsp:Transcript_52506/g.170546  ORF Transcript_52506/g.170546 Transcript_52506/m.170546 type:complete len:287 (-) Transcript_52506:109-969(-)